jgi:subtilase family serine protease
VAFRLPGSRRGALLTTLVVVVLLAIAAVVVVQTVGTAPRRPAVAAVADIPTVPAPISALSPAQIRAAYDVAPLAAQGIDGSRQTIIVVDSFGSPTIAADLARFDSYFKLPAPPSFRVIQPTGAVPAYSGNDSDRVGWAEETTLDVE